MSRLAQQSSNRRWPTIGGAIEPAYRRGDLLDQRR